MNLLESIAELFQRESEHLERINLLPNHVRPAVLDPEPIAPGEGYFRLWLSQMLLRNDREWFKTRYPVVESLTVFSFGTMPSVEIAQIAGPSRLRDLDATHLDRVIQADFPLTPLVPFSGGIVQIQAGLLAMLMQGGDLLQRFLDVVGSLSSLVAVPQLSIALGITGTAKKGVEQLMGIGDKQMKLGYQQTFTGKGGGGANELKPGYIALLGAPVGTYPAEQLWVQDSGLLVGQSEDSASPLTGVDYMLLRLEVRKDRDDWNQLTTIREPYDKAIQSLGQFDAAGNPREVDADIYIKSAALAAIASPDLSGQDRVRVAKAIREQYNEYKAAVFGQKDLFTPAAPTLEQIAQKSKELDPTPVDIGALFGSNWDGALNR